MKFSKAFALGCAVIIVGAATYLSLKRGDLSVSPQSVSRQTAAPVVKDPPAAHTPVFHPDSIVGFEWEAGGTTLSFQRQPKAATWTPEVSPDQIQNRLDRMAFFPIKEGVGIGAARVRVTLTFADKSTWVGAWDGQYFVWESGPHRGSGITTEGRDSRLFEEGALAFVERRSLELCQERPTKVSFVPQGSASENVALEQQGLKWLTAGLAGDGSLKEVDPTFAEQWIGRHCLLTIDSFLDQKMVRETDLPAVKESLIFAFAKSSQVAIEHLGDGLFRLKLPKTDKNAGASAKSMLFHSARLETAIHQLKEIKALKK